MGDADSPYARFQRALRTSSVTPALAAAAELPQLSLTDALELCALLARGRDPRYSRAAARWLGRLISETRTLELGDVACALGALELIRDGHARDGREPLAALAKRHGLEEVTRAATPRRWAGVGGPPSRADA